MRVIAVPVVLLGIALVIGAAGARRALACSAGPDFDPVKDSEVIVEGRLLGYEILPDAPIAELPKSDGTQDPYVPIRVDMAVTRVFKGDVAGGVIAIVDPVSLGAPLSGSEGRRWIGSGGACGAFDEDPTGKYAIMGLSEQDDGTYRPNRLRWLFYGDGPSGEAYQRALTRLSVLPPSAGFGPGSGSGAGLLVPAASLAGAGAVLLLAGAAWPRGARRG